MQNNTVSLTETTSSPTIPKQPTTSEAMAKEEPRLLTEREAAAYIRMSMSFLAKDRMNGYRHGIKQGPEFVKNGRRNIRYRIEDLDAWILKNRIIRQLPD